MAAAHSQNLMETLWRSTPRQRSVFSPAIVANRCNARVFGAFGLVYGHSDVVSNHDRWLVFRPTAQDASWKTRRGVHLDMNPWKWSSDATFDADSMIRLVEENNIGSRSLGLRCQGVLNLCDNLDADGGLQIVPGFHRHFDEWAKSLGPVADTSSRSFEFDVTQSIAKQAQRVTMRAGSIVIWDQRCAHGSRPNASGRVRMAQFLSYLPVKHLSVSQRTKRADDVAARLRRAGLRHKHSELSPVAQRAVDSAFQTGATSRS